MWSHYANYHKGFCIEYDTSKSELFEKYMLPIIYKKIDMMQLNVFLLKIKILVLIQFCINLMFGNMKRVENV